MHQKTFYDSLSIKWSNGTFKKPDKLTEFLMVRPFELHTIPKLDRDRPFKYSQHPKTGPSGFQMVIFRTLFMSGFQIVSHLVLVLPFC
jgi:hypothetical protein